MNYIRDDSIEWVELALAFADQSLKNQGRSISWKFDRFTFDGDFFQVKMRVHQNFNLQLTQYFGAPGTPNQMVSEGSSK